MRLTVRRHFHRSPEHLGPEEIRAYQLHLATARRLSASSLFVAVAALRFLYKVTLKKDWPVETVIPTPKQQIRLPLVLSREEVRLFLDAVTSAKHRVILATCYAAGLRIFEAVRLRASAIDSQRMTLRVEQGKGRQDRYVMLSPTLLQALRAWWRATRPTHWLFAGDTPGHHITHDAVERACRLAQQRSGLTTHVTPHSLPCLRRALTRGRHGRPHDPIAAGPSPSREDGSLSAPHDQHRLCDGEPARSAPEARWAARS